MNLTYIPIQKKNSMKDVDPLMQTPLKQG